MVLNAEMTPNFGSSEYTYTHTFIFNSFPSVRLCLTPALMKTQLFMIDGCNLCSFRMWRYPVS